MHIVIVGAGRIGRRLTELVLKNGNHNVIVIDKDKEMPKVIVIDKKFRKNTLKYKAQCFLATLTILAVLIFFYIRKYCFHISTITFKTPISLPS